MKTVEYNLMIMLIKKNGLHDMVVAYPSLKKMNSAEQR